MWLTAGRYALAVAAVALAGCGGPAYPPKHETQAQRGARLLCEGHRHSGDAAWQRKVMRCAHAWLAAERNP